MTDNENKNNGDISLKHNYTTEVSNYYSKGIEQRNYNYITTNAQNFKPVSAFEPPKNSNLNQGNSQSSTDNGGDKK